MSDRQRVLITGAAGLLGGIVIDQLGDKYELRGLDLRPTKRMASRIADATKLRLIRPAFEDVDVVVDLASDPDSAATWDRVYRNNIQASLNVLQASRDAGVRRVVFASSNHVTGMYEREHPYAAIVAGEYSDLESAGVRRITPDDPIRPDGFYALGKALAEAAARLYSDDFGLSTICVRIGTVNRANRPQQPRHYATLLTHRDFVHLIQCCIDAPAEARYSIVYGVSDNTWRFWDIASAEALGYEARDNAESWR